ncbi:uncharacterized protein MELLADRAFT_64185 [Melampsora larici-populina 98AG31]|uniref:WW domain-containing protein n=1 Tax=Melampsora larici-populina (strain 98AG31 / pathotype 3-4-7) TaxID=747676 RepID=F4RQB2_MELLP|nr:uncharacterized protein MELLADRAFT_64185 [Melampsora larici-populina 98AG31]EGG05375.1 hypothetical protein MELLADRAFT_64185 [Melampsora larici-populina 98AG31]
MNNKRSRNSNEDEVETNLSKRSNIDQSNDLNKTDSIELNRPINQLDENEKPNDKLTQEEEKEAKVKASETDDEKDQGEEDDKEEEEEQKTKIVKGKGKGKEISVDDSTEETVDDSTEENRSSSKGNTSEQDHQTVDPSASTAVFANGDWQAIYDYQQTAYYYVNTKTGESTWQNPFESTTLTTNSSIQINTSSSLNGIHPELAYLDSSLSLNENRSLSFKAQFNSRTGQFQSSTDLPNGNRFTEIERSRTQAKAYFDVEGWEKR